MKTKFGYTACERCAARVVVKVNERETLSYTCDECDFAPHTQKSAAGYGQFLTKIERTAPADPPKPPEKTKADEKKPDDKPAAKKRGFLDSII